MSQDSPTESEQERRLQATLLEFCQTPCTRKEIAAFLGIGPVSYAMQHYVQPLLTEGKLEMTMPKKLRSRNKKYRVVLYRCVGGSQSDG